MKLLARLLGSLVLPATLALPCATDAQETVLFAFDDHSIPWHHNLKVTLIPAQKHPGNPVLRRGPEGAPDHGHAILYGTVLRIDGKFRMWYLGMHETEIKSGQAPGFWRPMCYAESLDGIHWDKPNLGLVELNGGRNNNICLIEGEPHSLTRVNDFLSVLHDPEDPDPARRFKAVFIAHMPYDDIHGGMSEVGVRERRVGATICAISPDGLKWQVVGDRPANAGGERFEVSSLYRFGNFYYTGGQLISPWSWLADGADAARVMLTYRSPDFQTWSRAKAFSFARPGQLARPAVTGQQTHMGAGLWNRGNVLVGLYGMWQDPATPPPKGGSHLQGTHVDLGLILSNDGIHFREPVPNFKVISRGQEGDWDDTALLQGHAFVNEGDQTMIWYSHWDTGAKLKSMEIGLATLRRDGFGHLSRRDAKAPGHFVTSPFEVQAGTVLRINVEGVTPDGPLKAELLDDLDRPVAGASGNEAGQIREEGLAQTIEWPKLADTGLPANRKLALRITFPATSDARVYAVYVSKK